MDSLTDNVTSFARYGLPSRTHSASPPPCYGASILPALDTVPVPNHPDLVTVDTNFNPSLDYNMKMRFKNAEQNKDRRTKYTEVQRNKARGAVDAAGVDDFRALVSIYLSRTVIILIGFQIQEQLQTGKRLNDSKYIRLSSASINGYVFYTI